MLDQLFGMLLFGLGLTNPVSSPSVKGETTESAILRDANIKKRERELAPVFEVRKKRLTEELKTRRNEAVEKFKEEREAFKDKVAEIRDSKKKAAITRIDTKLSEINTKRTDQMMERLSRMSEIVDKVGVRSSEAKAAGKDTTTVDSLVVAARAAVTSAQAAVSTQAEKVYVALIASEENAGEAMGTTLTSLRTDINTTHAMVNAAHLSVQASVKELGKIL